MLYTYNYLSVNRNSHFLNYGIFYTCPLVSFDVQNVVILITKLSGCLFNTESHRGRCDTNGDRLVQYCLDNVHTVGF